MKVGIIYFNKMQWTEEQFDIFFKKKSIEVDFIEARNISQTDFLKYDVVLNRVYASVANQNQFDFENFVKEIRSLEDKEINIINSSFASLCDYDKDISSRVMNENGVLNPKGMKVKNTKDIKKFYKENHFRPFVFKPNTGGRGVSVCKINSVDEISPDLFIQGDSNSKTFLVQTLAKSIINFDYRVFVYNEKILFANTRTLVDGWLGSRSQGSKMETVTDIPLELNDIVVKATKSIQAKINSLDIVLTSDGFSVIENNPTPNFNESYVNILGFNPVEILVEEIINEFYPENKEKITLNQPLK